MFLCILILFFQLKSTATKVLSLKLDAEGKKTLCKSVKLSEDFQ